MADYDNPRPSSQPEGSTEMVVAKDNLITLDKLAVSDEPVLNRKGEQLTSFKDIGTKADEAIAEAVYSIGFKNNGTFQIGATVDSQQFTLTYNNEEYNTTAGPFPYTVSASTPDTDPADWFNVTLEARKTAAIAVGTPLSNMSYDTAGSTVVGYIFVAATNDTYSVPADAQGKTILTVVGDLLTTTDLVEYTLSLAATKVLPNYTAFKELASTTVGSTIEIGGINGLVIDNGSTITEVPGYIVPLIANNSLYWKRADWSGYNIYLSKMEGGHTEENFDIAIAYLESQVTGGVKKTALFLDGAVLLTAEKTIDPTKMSILSNGTGIITFDDSAADFATRYPSALALNLYSSRATSPVTVYEQNASSFATNIVINTTENNRTLDAAKISAVGEVISLNSMYNVRFTGFKDAITNGINGWGWSFFHCGWNDVSLAFNVSSATNTYERFDCHGCIIQNSGGAVKIDNPDGLFYWHGGSLDFCRPTEWDIVNGHVEVHGTHIEVTNRAGPYVKLGSTQSSFTQFGGLFTLRNTDTETVELFEQPAPLQVHLEGAKFVSDGTSLETMTVSSMRMTGGGHKVLDGTQRIFRCEGFNILSDDYQAIDATVVGSVGLIQNEGSIVLTSTGGGAKELNLFVPLAEAGRRYSFQFNYASDTSGVVFQTKRFTTIKGNDTTNRYNFSTIVPGSGDTITSGSGLVDMDGSFVVPEAGNNFIWLNLNMANMLDTESITITDIKLYSY